MTKLSEELSEEPLVSVVMPVHNGERYLHTSVESILSQTFNNFEFIIIDDGSTDETPKLLDLYSQLDRRIHIHRLKSNMGVVNATNAGCLASRGKYIARMDADDISLPTRLIRQVEFLERNSEIGILGTQTKDIDEFGLHLGYTPRETRPELIHWNLYFYCPLAQPTIMMRRKLVQSIGFYTAKMTVGEDFDLWTRASRITKIANLPDILLYYRVWSENATSAHKDKMGHTNATIIQNSLQILLGERVSIETAGQLSRLTEVGPTLTLRELEHLAHLILRIYGAHIATCSPPKKESRAIATSAAVKLQYLGALAARFSFTSASHMMHQSLKLSPYSPVVALRKQYQKLRR